MPNKRWVTLPTVNCRPFASEVVFHHFLAFIEHVFAIFYHWIKRNKCVRENLPERSNNWWVYFIFSIAFIWKSTWRVKHCSLLINFFSHSMHWRNEMLGVVEHIHRFSLIWFFATCCSDKFCCRNKDFHKHSPEHTKRFVAVSPHLVAATSRPTCTHGVICRRDVLLQLVA